jgi:hypothetical protein
MLIFDREKIRRHFQGANWGPFAILILLEILFALVVLRSPGTTDASNFFLVWTERAFKDGLIGSYGRITDDYPPFSSVILFSAAKIGALFSVDVFLSFKLSLVAALLCTTICFWAWTLDAVWTGVMAFSLYFNGVALGYIDTYWAPVFILSLWALQKRRIGLFSGLFALSSLVKWQPLIVAPFLVLHALSIPVESAPSGRMLLRRWVHLAAPAGAVVLSAGMVFGFRTMVASLDHALNQELLSGDALNFNWLVTWFFEAVHPEWYGGMTDGIVKAIIIDPSVGWAIGIKLIFVLFYLCALWRLFRSRASFSSAIECSLVGYLSYFILNVGVHENHLFLATILAVVAAALLPGKAWRAAFIVAASNLNLIAFYGFTGSPLPFSPVVGIDVSILFSAVNVALFLFVWSDLVFRGANLSAISLAEYEP